MRPGAIVLLALGVLAAAPAGAQYVPTPPDLQNRIPAPLPPPPQPPVINGPLGQGAAPGVYSPRRLRSSGERAQRCLHSGAGHGLKGEELDAYARACANAN